MPSENHPIPMIFFILLYGSVLITTGLAQCPKYSEPDGTAMFMDSSNKEALLVFKINTFWSVSAETLLRDLSKAPYLLNTTGQPISRYFSPAPIGGRKRYFSFYGIKPSRLINNVFIVHDRFVLYRYKVDGSADSVRVVYVGEYPTNNWVAIPPDLVSLGYIYSMPDSRLLYSAVDERGRTTKYFTIILTSQFENPVFQSMGVDRNPYHTNLMHRHRLIAGTEVRIYFNGKVCTAIGPANASSACGKIEMVTCDQPETRPIIPMFTTGFLQSRLVGLTTAGILVLDSALSSIFVWRRISDISSLS